MYKKGIYKNFDKLININNIFFNNAINYNIRDEKYIPYIEKRLILLNNTSLDIKELLNVMGLIILLQPFYDGNNRTTKIYIKEYLLKHNYNFDITYNLPLLYDINDKITDTHIKKLNQYISKI